MDTRLAVRDEALMPTTFDGLLKQAQVLVKSGLLPDAVKTAEAAVVIMLKGRELDIPPMQAFASIYVVKGKPTIGAQLMGALILREGHTYHVESLTDTGCTITFTRRGGKPYTHQFTLDDAKKAGLLNNDTWTKYTKAMLFSRCMSAGARIAMPDVLAGMYTPEELTDSVVVDAETGEITATGQVVEAKSDPLKVEVVTPGNGGNEHKQAESGHGFKTWSDKAKAAFWARANALGISKDAVHFEFRVTSMNDYQGSMEDAADVLQIIKMGLDKTLTLNQLHEALGVEYVCEWTYSVEEAGVAIGVYLQTEAGQGEPAEPAVENLRF